MAKSNLSWALEGPTLLVEVLAIEKKLSFDVTEIYPLFLEYTEVQQKIIANGLKQKLADCLARNADEKLTPLEMVEELNAMWERLVAGNWNRPGSNKGGGIKKAELQATVTAQQAKLDDMGIKLAEAMALVEKLTAKVE